MSNVDSFEKEISTIAKSSIKGDARHVTLDPGAPAPVRRLPKADGFNRDDVVFAGELGRFLWVAHAEEGFLTARPCNQSGELDPVHPPLLIHEQRVLYHGRKS